jgi:hypothetical protein
MRWIRNQQAMANIPTMAKTKTSADKPAMITRWREQNRRERTKTVDWFSGSEVVICRSGAQSATLDDDPSRDFVCISRRLITVRVTTRRPRRKHSGEARHVVSADDRSVTRSLSNCSCSSSHAVRLVGDRTTRQVVARIAQFARNGVPIRAQDLAAS